MCGDLSRMYTVDHHDSVCARLASAGSVKRVRVPGAGHLVVQEKPKDVAVVLRDLAIPSPAVSQSNTTAHRKSLHSRL